MAKTFDELVPAPKGRFDGIERPYSPDEVERLRGSVQIAYTLAEKGANRLWESLKKEPFVNSLGAVTGNQAMQQARAGLNAIYLSGWQVAADANTAGAMYPDQSLYPANAGPELARRINRTFQRADQIEHSEGGAKIDWFVPIVADAEAGFGGPLNSFEIMKAYIEAGAAGVHFEDQLASEKKCGHMGGKVLIPTAAHERNLIAARLAADVCGVPTFVLARTDAESAKLITADVDERDREFITGERTAEGFFRLKEGTGHKHCIKRGLATLAFDGPGQGETVFEMRWRKDFERAIVAVIDYLERRAEIDHNRIGIIGRSMGGFYAPKTAAIDKRIKALVAWGVMYHLRNLAQVPKHTLEGFMFVSNSNTLEEAKQFYASVDLTSYAPRITCPTLVVHGGLDVITPLNNATSLVNDLKGRVAVETMIWDDSLHCCHDRAHIVRPGMADFMRKHLAAA